MIHGIPAGTMVAVLLDTLEKERHLRKPLLCNLVDELSANDGFGPALDRALALLEQLEGGLVSEATFVRRLTELRDLSRGVVSPDAGIQTEA